MRIYETLFILYKCNKSINTTWKVYNQSSKTFEDLPEFQNILINQIVLEYVNFIDEFNYDFKNLEVEYHERIKLVRTISKPILKRINKWKNLEKFRNNFIGHAFRDSGKFVIPDPNIYSVPRTGFEVFQLVLFVNYIFQIIENIFEKEVHEMFSYMYTLLPKPLREIDHSSINEDLENMGKEVDDLCKQFNVEYPLGIMGFILPDDSNNAE